MECLLPIARYIHDKNGVKLFSKGTKLRSKIDNKTEQGVVPPIHCAELEQYKSYDIKRYFLQP